MKKEKIGYYLCNPTESCFKFFDYKKIKPKINSGDKFIYEKGILWRLNH